MARAEHAKAETLAGTYDPNAAAAAQGCPDLLGSSPCWSSTAHPTNARLESAEEHRRRAAEHRAASLALRDAEARACAGLSESDRDESPFEHREDIAAVTPLYIHVPDPDAYETDAPGRERFVGATITFRAVPGMTAQLLQRIVNCHLARNAALGHEVPEMPTCPLVPKKVTAHVRPTATGFAVDVRSNDPDSAREVLRRAQALPVH